MFVVYFFIEFFVLENVHFDCEFCDSFLIFFLLFVFEFVAFFVVSSILKNFSNENQSSISFSSTKNEVFVIEKKIVFIFYFFVCVFVNSLIESLLAFVFFVFELNCVIFCVESSAFLNSEKCEIVRKKKKKIDEKIVIKNDVSNLCEMNNSSFSSLNKFCIKAIEIEKEKKSKKIVFVSSSLQSILL